MRINFEEENQEKFDFSPELYYLFDYDEYGVFVDPELKKTMTTEKAAKLKEFIRSKRQAIVSALANWAKKTGKNLLQVAKSSPKELAKALASAGLTLAGGLTWNALFGVPTLLGVLAAFLVNEGIVRDAIAKARQS